jgi:hypothetical protein
VDLIRSGLEQGAEEIAGYVPGGLFVQLNEGELGSAVDGDEQVKSALLGTDLGDVDVKVASRVRLEFLAGGPVAFHVRKPGDAVALEASVQGGAG